MPGNICNDCIKAADENKPELHCHDKRHCFCLCRPGERVNQEGVTPHDQRPSQQPTE